MMLATAPQTSLADQEDRESIQECKDRDHSANFFFMSIFSDESAVDLLLGPMPAADKLAETNPPRGLPAYLAHLWTVPLLTAEQEHHGFRKLNYLKYRSSCLDSSLRSCMGCAAMLRDLKHFNECSVEVRNLLIESNLRLVISLAKKYASSSSLDFDEMVCVGNAALVRAVDLFDFRREIRFSTYAYHAIQTSIFGAYRKESRMNSRFVADGTVTVESAISDAGECDVAELKAVETRDQVIQLMEALDDRDKQIVMARFGINRKHNGVAFHVIAKEIGLSTTRTIQLYHRSLSKMHALLSRSIRPPNGNQCQAR